MIPRAPSPLVEVYLLVEQPRQRLSHWSQALSALDDAAAPRLASVDAYYDPASNQAILGLRYDEQELGPSRLSHIVEIALLAEVGMIQPAELSEGDRRRFVGDRLAGCTVHVANQRKVLDALIELVRRVRAQKGGTSPPALEATLLPRPRPAVAPKVRARVDTGESGVVVAAKGTRHPPDREGREEGEDPASRPGPTSEVRLPRGTGELALGSVRQHRSQLAELDRQVGPPPRPTGSPPGLAVGTEAPELQAVPARTKAATVPPARGEGGSRSSPNVVARAGVHRAATVMLSSAEARRLVEAAAGQPAQGADEAPTDREPSPAQPALSAPRMISARYLRSGRWVPLRVGSLSLKGAALMAVALPRVDDRVDVVLAYAQHRALVRGAVQKVSTMMEAETSGATMFSVNFELDDGSRRQLIALLTAARAANVTIKPAPPRGTRRYPVEWPVCLGTSRGAVRAEAFDVSADGMFVKPVHPLTLDAHVTFSAVLDDNQPPVSGHARVVRNITEADAQDTGLWPGYGLVILEMADPERERWSRFLRRVASRATKRVLIAASAARLTELEAGLIAGGYATTGGTEPGAIAQLVSAEARPFDAALIDAAWLLAEGSTLWVESVFTAHSVRYVTVHGDAKKARQAVDRLLAVV